MCGRFGFAKGIDDFSKKYSIPLSPRYNIAPTQNIVAVDGNNKAFTAQWSYTPEWSTQPMGLINARIESLDQKPSFKGYEKCLIPASGWYEWGKIGSLKVPYYYSAPQDWFFMAGIRFKNDVVIVTTEAKDSIRGIHHRMPIVLNVDASPIWNCENDQLANSIQAYSVSSHVNKVSFDSEKCIAPYEYLSLFD